MAFLIRSYSQTIKEYPSAGGAYIVTKDIFGLFRAVLNPAYQIISHPGLAGVAS